MLLKILTVTVTMKMALVFLFTLDNLSGNQLKAGCCGPDTALCSLLDLKQWVKAGCSVTLHTRDGRKYAHVVEEGSSYTERELQDATEIEEMPTGYGDILISILNLKWILKQKTPGFKIEI